MPATSIRDLVIKDDDLVVGTHGRSFWILDDITPLRQAAPSVFAANAHLFTPAATYRFRWNKNTDTPLPPDEPAGENPPAGAILNYWLKSDARVVTLEILDDTKAIVRRYSSGDPPEPLVEGRNTPDYWIRPHRALSARGGFHRFVWDLHHERPAVPSFSYPIAAIYMNTPRTPLGSWVLPGTYTVRLTVDGQAFTAPLIVRLDPRVHTPPDGLKMQYEMSRMLDDALRRVAGALTAKRGSAETLTRLQGQLTQLFGVVEGTDAAPTSQTIAAVHDVLAAVGAAVGDR
jgi:hypothetical protein